MRPPPDGVWSALSSLPVVLLSCSSAPCRSAQTGALQGGFRGRRAPVIPLMGHGEASAYRGERVPCPACRSCWSGGETRPAAQRRFTAFSGSIARFSRSPHSDQGENPLAYRPVGSLGFKAARCFLKAASRLV